VGVLDATNSTTCSLAATDVCDNLPRPNVVGRYEDLGGNAICDCTGDLTLDGTVNGADRGGDAVSGGCAVTERQRLLPRISAMN
jgi:hypothetical protein